LARLPMLRVGVGTKKKGGGKMVQERGGVFKAHKASYQEVTDFKVVFRDGHGFGISGG